MASTLESRISIERKLDFQTLKAFFPAVFGTVVEYYDYTLYGFCASLLAAQFFPSDNETVALLKTFGVFLTGSFAKPFGAMLFGYIGDRYGRSISLKISMLGIAIPTTCIGLLPTYQDIGWIAPLLLLICRILQGILTGGEADSVRVFVYESFFKNKPCFANSLTGVAMFIGIYVASLASSWIMQTADPNFYWRLPFVFGGILGVIVFWLRFYMHETAEFMNYLDKQERHKMASDSLFNLLVKNRRIIFIAILFCGASGGTYHFYLVFLGRYLSSTLQILDPEVAARMTSHAILIFTLCIPLAAFLADRFGLTRIIKMFFRVLLITLGLNIWMILKGAMPLWLMGATAGIIACYQAPMYTLLMQKISVGERCRCLSVGHTIGSLLFSGSAPLISLWLWQQTEIAIIPFIYFGLLALMGFLGVVVLQARG